MAQVAKPQAAKTNNGNFQDKEKPMEVRMSNITAAKGNGAYIRARVFSYYINSFFFLSISCGWCDPYIFGS